MLPSRLAQAQEASRARRDARWAVATTFLYIVGFPVIWPMRWLLLIVRAAIDAVRGVGRGKEKAS